MRGGLPAPVLVILILLAGCSTGSRITAPTDSAIRSSERGLASWYGEPYHGRRTASGETYDMHDMTAAHRTLPFGTEVRVTRRDTGAEVKVRINDRGPFVSGRIIDLSWAAARTIGLDIDGVAPVDLAVVRRGDGRRVRADTIDPETCFWIQVGAFGDPENAARAVDRLRAGGEKAMSMEGPEGLSRVRVGPFTDPRDADSALLRLLDEWPPAKVIPCGG